MKKTLLTLLLFISSASVFAQNEQLSIFSNLVNRTWKAEGKWENGKPFIQESSFEYGANGKVIVVKTKGIIDEKTAKVGDRNHGIRQFEKENGIIRFWEFDYQGNLTKGSVFGLGRNLMYQYQYQNFRVTDLWEYIDENTYKLTVGFYENNNWKQIFLQTTFKAVEKK
ncbi:MAG: hypothetical protein N4A45_00295 [Flavobacteriales bacterium]|nr:hypothetical protein [Flavobacteriales bacterium]